MHITHVMCEEKFLARKIFSTAQFIIARRTKYFTHVHA
jgi:hypothetical protein